MAGWHSGGVPTDGCGVPHVDVTVVAALVDDLGPDAVADLCQLFVSESQERVRTVRSASGSSDADVVARSAHRLKSACGFLGAGGLAALCARIERAARDDRLAEVAALVDLLADELEAVVVEVRSAIADLCPGRRRPGPASIAT